MRKASVFALCLVVVSACRREPDFDERYDAATEKIGDTAAEIDAQITGTATPGPRDEEP